MRKKIGFIQPDDDGESQVPAVSSSKVDNLKRFIEMLYQPDGLSKDKDFKTSVDIAYELDEMISVSPALVAKVMTAFGYNVTTVDNQVCFVVYLKNNEADDDIPF